MEIDWRAAVLFVSRQPAWTRTVGVGGLLMLVLPPLGWVLALGYRSLVAHQLIERGSPILPPWRGNVIIALRRGAASSAVILTYLTPFFVLYWGLGLQRVDSLLHHWRELAVFVAAVVVFPPVVIPTLPLIYAARYDWLSFAPGEIAFLVLTFLAPIALLPAAFLQVARHGRFTAALDIVAALRLVASAPRAYVEAWVVSLTVSASAVLVLPLGPWMLFWSYLVISHVFLQVLAAAHRESAEQDVRYRHPAHDTRFARLRDVRSDRSGY